MLLPTFPKLRFSPMLQLESKVRLRDVRQNMESLMAINVDAGALILFTTLKVVQTDIFVPPIFCEMMGVPTYCGFLWAKQFHDGGERDLVVMGPHGYRFRCPEGWLTEVS